MRSRSLRSASTGKLSPSASSSQADPGALGLHLEEVQLGGQHLLQLQALRALLDLARLALVEVQQVADQVQQGLAADLAAGEHLVDLGRLLVEHARQDDVDVVQDGGQRAFQLVGHHGDEAALLLVRLPLQGDVVQDQDGPDLLLAAQVGQAQELHHALAQGLPQGAGLPALQHLLHGGQHLGAQAQLLHAHPLAVGLPHEGLRGGVHQHRQAVAVQHDHPFVHGVDELPGQVALAVELGQVLLAVGEQAVLAQGPLHHVQQVLGGEGLGQEVEGAVAGDLHGGFHRGQRRNDDHHRALKVLVDEAGDLEAVDPRHLEVHQGQAVAVLAQQAQGGFPVLGRVHAVTLALEGAAHAFAHALLVVDDDDPDAFCLYFHDPPDRRLPAHPPTGPGAARSCRPGPPGARAW